MSQRAEHYRGLSLTEKRKGEVGVSKFIPTHLICPFFDEPFFA